MSSDAITCDSLASGFIETFDTTELFRPQNAWFIPRAVAEGREDFKQVIPYLILEWQGRVAAYRRTKAGSESRLHEKWSVGFGGHVNLADARLDANGFIDIAATLARAGERELDEEVRVGSVARRTPLGLVYDDRNQVGRVHLGVVELWSLEDDTLAISEDAVAECRFLSLAEIEDFHDRLESWSQLCIDALKRALVDSPVPNPH